MGLLRIEKKGSFEANPAYSSITSASAREHRNRLFAETAIELTASAAAVIRRAALIALVDNDMVVRAIHSMIGLRRRCEDVRK